MNEKLAAYARAQGLFDGADRVVCALSGGADSVCLLHILMNLRQEFGFTLSAAHFNHCLRGAESDGDEAFVRELCQKMEIPLVTGSGDAAAYAAQHGMSLEEAARVLRYDFLLAQPGLIAVAHHADDQAETVLINLLRGTGLKGLCAMAPRQDRVIRPLLTVTRTEILALLEENSISYRTDSTNFTDDALRNRLRHHVMPLLYRENPGLAATVARMTGILRQEDRFLDDAAASLLKEAETDGGWRCETLKKADPVLLRRALRRLLDGISDPSMAHVEAAQRLLDRENGSAELHLPGNVRLRREYGLLRVVPEGTCDGPWQVCFTETAALETVPDQKTVFALRAGLTLTVRTRQTGDVLRLPGGTKSVKKLMIDRKLPAHLRETIPVIACEQVVAAVWGLGADRDLAAKAGEPAVIVEIKTNLAALPRIAFTHKKEERDKHDRPL